MIQSTEGDDVDDVDLIDSSFVFDLIEIGIILYLLFAPV